jgi:predicted dehydrogenase
MQVSEGQEDDLPTLNIGFVGCGWFGMRAHLPALLKLERGSAKSRGFGVKLAACVIRSPDARRQFAKKLGKSSAEVNYGVFALILRPPSGGVVYYSAVGRELTYHW